jgi:hypothetical protein
MSSVGSLGSTAVATVYDPTAGTGYQMQVNGGVYRVTPAAAADGEIQSFRLTSTGEMYVASLSTAPLHAQGPAADNAAASGNPLRSGGVYTLADPTYDNGDIASLRVDINGKLHTTNPTLESSADQINLNTAAQEGLLTSILGAVDGLEALIGTTNTSLSTIDGRVDGLETLIGTTNTTLSTIDGRVDGLETLIGTTNTTLSTIDGRVDGVEALLTSIDTHIPQLVIGQDLEINSLSVTVASDQPAIPVYGATPAVKTVKAAAITVGTSAVRLTTDAAAPDADRVYLAFEPDQASTGRFFVGGSGVASSGASRGVEVFPGQLCEFRFDAGEYYIISDTAAQTVYVTEQE